MENKYEWLIGQLKETYTGLRNRHDQPIPENISQIDLGVAVANEHWMNWLRRLLKELDEIKDGGDA